MKAHQSQLDVIGNNIANVNTFGFKSSHDVFLMCFYQTLQNATGGSATMEEPMLPRSVMVPSWLASTWT